MLDKNILSQLSQLKSEIQASKEYGSGQVAGTNGRFGFVRLEDGRDAFLSPEKMQHVIPGDRITVSLTSNDKGQLEASLEKLEEQSLTRFLGQYKATKKGHFVVPLGEAVGMKSTPINRWIFLPPKARGRCKDGDMVVAKLTQHPFADGKASARVLERIGQQDEAFIERKFVTAKYDLIPRYNEAATRQTRELEKLFSTALDHSGRTDMTAIGFVTIDSASTRDMDDALAISRSDSGGFQLQVAIADPGAFITPKSPLAQFASKNAQSLYLLGGAVPMLPESLANDCFSLRAGEIKPALVCSLEFDAEGELKEFAFAKAVVKSANKLSYQQVSAMLAGEEAETETPVSDDTLAMLRELAAFAELRHRYRQQHYVVGDDQQEYDYLLNAAGKIDKVSPRARTIAHQIVEESMLATNQCAGTFLEEKGLGLFTTHAGFREDRLGEVKALLKEEAIEYGDDLLDETNYLALIHQLTGDEQKKHLLSPLRRMMPASEPSLEPGPHLGIGMHRYATVTSPIRRWVDMYNHWAISHAIGADPDNSFKPITSDTLDAIRETLNLGRQADREIFQWLLCQYAQPLVGQTGTAKIRIVTQQGFGARLLDNGIDGFVLFPKKQEKTFDAKRMTLTTGDVTYGLEMDVTVKLESVDMDKRRIAFTLA